VKRRDFIKQSLSASAVVVGSGYASWDMIGLKTTSVEKPIQDRAKQAAARVLTAANPSSDEGVIVQASVTEPAIQAPEMLSHSRPALAYEQHKAEQLMAKIPSPKLSQPSDIETPIEEIVLTEAQKAQTDDVVFAKPNESANSVQEKIANFEANFTDDVVLTEAEYKTLVQSLERINRVQDYVGFGNFNVLSFDEALKYGKYSPRIGEFTAAEKEFLDKLFNYDTSQLGFFGEKVIGKQTNVISSKDVVKMPGTGHFVFRGHPEDFYNKIRTEVGESLVLTSGVRNIVKQYQLYMAKTVQASGNLSRASRSLAPPGHSYHAIGDFDVGQVGGGFDNFTAAFAKTDEFKRLQDLGYVKIRYTADNDLGVRYEPWHIRVV
jgi:hypothetical protein